MNPNISYHQDLLKIFAQIYLKNQDIMQNMSLTLPILNPNRQQILFTQYPMQKKGKKFGTVQQRTFRIDDNILKQIDKNGQQRDLPYPISVIKQTLTQNSKNQWGFLQQKYRLLLQFQERTPIYIYLKTKQQLIQIYSFLCSKIHVQQKDILNQVYNKIYKIKLMNYLIKKLSRVSMSKKYGGNKQNRRIIIINKLKSQFTDINIFRQFISQWHKRAVMTSKDPQKIPAHQQTSIMNVKDIVSELAFNLQQLKNISQFSIKSGELKLWVGQKTYQKIIKITYEQVKVKYYQIIQNKIDINRINPFHQINVFNLKESFVKYMDYSAISSVNYELIRAYPELEILEILFQQQATRKLLLCGVANYLFNYQQQLPVPNVKLQKYSFHPSIHHFLPLTLITQLLTITNSFGNQFLPQQQKNSLNLQYIIAYQQYLQTQSIQSLSFSNFHKLYNLLQIDSIIDKFYTTHPYNQYINVQHKGTFVYEYLVKIADKFAYYDAQKFIWKYQCSNIRRFLSVIKAFDQFPRINYTQSFYFLCLKCLKLAQRQSLIKWKSHMFANTLLGRQSLAFFMVLGILKSATQLLLYQQNKNVLASNTLLFHYVLKKYTRSLYNKFLHIQLNIQAYFGINLVSILSNLFSNTHQKSYGGSQQIYIFILISYLLQRRQCSKHDSPLKSNKQIHKIKTMHYISLIAMFLAIIQLFDIIISSNTRIQDKNKNKDNKYDKQNIVGNSSAYSSAKNYMYYLRIFVCTQLQLYMPQLIILHHKYSTFCSQQFNTQHTQYITLQQNIQHFHIQNNPVLYNNQNAQQSLHKNIDGNGNGINHLGIGELMEQMYSQFMCYKYKNQEDIRKICIVIDHVYFGDSINIQNNNGIVSSSSYRPPSLLIQLIQNSSKIYQHQYILPPYCLNSPTKALTLQNIKHTIQVKLSRISTIQLFLTYINSTLSTQPSFSTTIDPKQIPSNYYIQQIKQLNPISYTNNIIHDKIYQLYRQSYVNMQVYIKDSCDVDYIQNTVPNLYINLLLLKDRIQDNQEQYKQDIIFCNQFFKTFRLTQNNFNLLYAKLGWYGNHYLVPADRLVLTHLVIPNQFSTNSSNSNHSNLPANLQNSQQTITALNLSYPQLIVKPMPTIHLQRINQILFYTRCIYGHGLIPSIAYPGYSGTNTNPQIVIQSIRGNHMLTKQYKNLRNQINQYQFNSCGNMITYPLENFNTLNNYTSHRYNNNGVTSNQVNHNIFIDFYIRAMEQLPLIRYLCFRPLQFYLLQQTKFILKVPISTTGGSLLPQILARNYNSTNYNQSQHNTKLSNSSQKLQHSNYNSVNSLPNTIRTYQIILTNHPILMNNNKNNNNSVKQKLPYKFVSNPSELGFPDLYENYQNVDNNQINDNNWGKNLYIKLVQNVELPSVMYFTYPQAIYHSSKKDDLQMTIDGLSGSGSRQILLNQFLYLLKYNIYKYYIKQKITKKQQQNPTKPIDKKQKNKTNVKLLDCQLQFVDKLIPNVCVSKFFQYICQTKNEIQINVTPILPILFSQISQNNKNMQSISMLPLILNPLYRHYTSYTLLGGIWKPVCILAKLVTPNYQIYYLEQKQTKKYRIVKSNDTLLGIEAKRMIQRLPMFKFTDHEVLHAKQCVRKQLIRIL